MKMTHREARRKLGSRSNRRSGIKARRTKSGAMRKTTKTRLAVAVWRLVRGNEV